MAQKHGKDIQFVWWHSHGSMKAFWSGTDTDTMKEYASGLWSMFLVVNIHEEYKFRVQMWEPIAVGEDISLTIMNAPGEEIPKSIATEVLAKCSTEYPGTGWKKAGHYTRGHNNSEQLSLGDGYTSRQEIKEYNRGFGIEDDEDLAVKYLITKLDELNKMLCDGEIRHKSYRKTISTLNHKMESNKFDYRVQLPKSNNELDALIQVSFAWDMIVDKETGQPAEPDYSYGSVYCV